MKPFSADRPRLPLKPLAAPPANENVTVRLAAGGTPTKRPESASCAVPQVEAIKQGDKVVRLVVTCGCGERIEIDCLYPAGG